MTYKIPQPAIHHLLKAITEDTFVLRAPDNQEGTFIVFQSLDRDNSMKHHLNQTAGSAGNSQTLMQIDAYAEKYYTAKELGASIEYILDGFSGTVYHGSNSPLDFVEIGGITLQNDVDILDQTDTPRLFRSSATYLVTYKQ